jgi:WD40 repeat protein
MKKVVLYIGLLILLSSCIAPTIQQPTLTTTEITRTSQPTVMMTSLPTSTETISPTNTPTQTTNPTRTPIPSPTADLAATVMATQTPMLYASYPSPVGMWRMDITIYDCAKTIEGNENAYEQLVLVNLISGEGQLADEQLQYCGGLGAYGFEGRYWSPDSQIFYYTSARQGVPDGCGYWEPPLFRFNVNTLEIEDLGIGLRSPDGGKIVTWNSSEQALVIWNINDDEIARYPAFTSNAEIGSITWSPDGQSLVYLQVDSWCPLSGKSYLVLVDISKPEQSLLLESEKPTFGSVEWDFKTELRLYDENGEEWQYNLLTDELTQVP